MGIILAFQHSARIPKDWGGEREASASNVICAQPFSRAIRTKSAHRCAGMKPRPRQVLTVLGGTPSSAETVPVPPRSSIAESTVIMEPYIVRSTRTCQVFANCETTLPFVRGSIGAMHDPPEVIGPRLKALRLALDMKTQTKFAKAIGVEKNTYNPWEKGTRPLPFEAACNIRKNWGVPLDWLFYGTMADRIPVGIYNKLGRVA